MRKPFYLVLFIFFGALMGCNQSSNDELESLENGAINDKPDFEAKIVENYTGKIGECGEAVYDFKAGSNSMDAGDVIVSYDENYLYVKVTSTAGFQDVEENLKMWIGTNLNDLPTSNGTGAPINGQFPYKANVSGDTHVFQIALSDIDGGLDCDEQFYIVVHGDVMVEYNGQTSAQTAYAGDKEGEGNRWWWYMEESVECCEEKTCLDAYGYKKSNPEHSYCIDPNGIFLGWTNQFNYYWLKGKDYQFPLYASIDDCDPLTGSDIEVGIITITFYEEIINGVTQRYTDIFYELKEGYEFESASVKLSQCDVVDFDNCTSSMDYSGDLQEFKSLAEFKKLPWPGSANAWDGYVYPTARICIKGE